MVSLFKKEDQDKSFSKKNQQKSKTPFSRIITNILLSVITLLLLMVVFVLPSYFSFSGNSNSGDYFSKIYEKSIIKETSTDTNDITNSPFSNNGCYLAYICPTAEPQCSPSGESDESCGDYLGDCSSNSDCCSDCCQYGECRLEGDCCTIESGSCSSNSDCCSGLECSDGSCQNVCEDYLGDCSSGLDCCSGCCQYGECRLEVDCEELCGSISATCSSNSDCCDSLSCLGGTCQPTPAPAPTCLALQAICTMGSQCCSSTCQSGICQCIAGGYSCPGTGSCCSPYSCVNGMCVNNS